MAEKDIRELRRQYTKKILSEKSVNPDPLKQFDKWFKEVLSSGFIEPNAVVLATSDKKCKPSARMLLLKGYDESGFVFYTNYKSRKGEEITVNPQGTLLFYWDKLERQVRIEGTIEKISKKESEDYFKTRPFKSRLGAWASKQSSVISGRSVVVKEFLKYLMKYRNNVPLPPYWGGYRLLPNYYEFWQGRPNRLHDRIAYKFDKGKWRIFRLSP
jgi:pyridoxamine 5'-phosphate oxidase